MKPTTRIAIAGLLSAAGAALNAFAAELSGATPPENPSEPVAETQPEPAKPKRTRAVKEEQASVAETTAPAEEKTAPVDGANDNDSARIVSEEQYQELRAMIEPLVKGGQGADVKTIIAKYSDSGKLREIRAAQKAAFEKDIEAISL